MLEQLNKHEFAEDDIQFWKERLSNIPAAITGNVKTRTPVIRTVWFRMAAAVLIGIIGIGVYYLYSAFRSKKYSLQKKQCPLRRRILIRVRTVRCSHFLMAQK